MASSAPSTGNVVNSVKDMPCFFQERPVVHCSGDEAALRLRAGRLKEQLVDITLPIPRHHDHGAFAHLPLEVLGLSEPVQPLPAFLLLDLPILSDRESVG